MASKFAFEVASPFIRTKWTQNMSQLHMSTPIFSAAKVEEIKCKNDVIHLLSTLFPTARYRILTHSKRFIRSSRMISFAEEKNFCMTFK